MKRKFVFALSAIAVAGALCGGCRSTSVEPGYYSTPDGDWLKATETSLRLGEEGGATYARLENKTNANLTDPEDDVKLQYRIKKGGHGRYLLVREAKGSFPKMALLFSRTSVGALNAALSASEPE